MDGVAARDPAEVRYAAARGNVRRQVLDERLHRRLERVIDAVEEKIRRIRGAGGDLSPAWAVPRDDELPSQSDRWARPIIFAFVGCLSIALLLFIGFRVLLGSGINALTAVASEGRR